MAWFTQIESRTGAENIAFRAFPQGKPIAVEFDTNSPSYQALSQREKKEQQLDWLLYAVATSSDLPAVEIEQALYDLPPVRTDALAHLASLNTGEGRSRVLGSKKAAVVALIPRGDVNTQAALLADIADEQRKNTGEIPEQLHVFEYELLPEAEGAQLVYVGVRPGQNLFEMGAGYIEQRVGTLDDLQRFLKETDDVVAARLDGSTLIIGGRKFKSHGMKGIGVDEIASIWQSSRKDPTAANTGPASGPRPASSTPQMISPA